MKKIILMNFVIALGGCAMQQVSHDLSNNKYIEYSPISTDLTGTYVAAIGSAVTTYRFKNDGTGYSCYSYLGKTVVSDTKIFDKIGTTYKLISQEGGILEITATENNQLTLKSYGYEYKVISDDNLRETVNACKPYF